MSFPLAFLLMLAGLIVSAFTKYHGIPALWLLSAVLLLALVAVVLQLIRVMREEFRRQPVIKTVKWERA